MSVIGQDEGIVHGTLRGYRQHRYRDVPSCEPCLQALRDDYARRTANGPIHRTKKPKQAPARPYGIGLESTPARPNAMTREPALTYTPYRDDEASRAAERRERVKAAMRCWLLDPDPGDLLDALGIPADEVTLGREVAARMGGQA